jgi:predicted enzyme related to lactoylglutathione lyase
MGHIFGKFVWFEHNTTDVGKAKGFYGELFGWGVQSLSMGETSYEMITAGETPIGGYVKLEGKGAPHWTSYVSVEDVDATAKKIVAAGGKVLAPAFDVPTVGRMSQVADPQGASFWIMRGTEDAPDAPPAAGRFFWNELWARDGKKAAAFYRDVLGYTVKDAPMPDGTYHVLEAGGGPRAGIMTSPDAKAPPAWLPYVAVDDCDATLAKARKLGASIQLPATDVPEVGRFAVLRDPNGAAIAVIKPLPMPR